MGLQFLADQCVPTAVVADFCDAGYEVWYLRDHIRDQNVKGLTKI